jgi:hypothetical protein
VRILPLLQGIVLGQILASGFAGHARFHCTHADGCSLVALANELGELVSCDHNPQQHPPPRPVSNSKPSHPGKPPVSVGNFNCRQGVILIVAGHGDYHNNINVQIVLLPAIPPAWAKASSFKGLRARGGHTVDCTWQNGRLTDCQIMTDSGPTPVKIRLNGELREINTTAAITDMGTAAASGPGAAMWQVGKAQAHLPPPVTAPSSPGSGPQANRFKSAASSDRMLKSTDDRRFGGG